MNYKIYQVDAFTDTVFSGNPASVCPLSEWLSDEILQKIAMENNLSETVFYVENENQYEIRWFTPKVEVDLCGHATLAAAYVLFYEEKHVGDLINFYSPRSGKLTVVKSNKDLTLNFPTDNYSSVPLNDALTSGFDILPIRALKGSTDYVLVYENEKQIIDLNPNLLQIAKLKARGIIVTAKGDTVDFVSRFFAPQSGVNEDPVTGSAHTTLIPFWSKELNKLELSAIQLSERKGVLNCKLLGDRVEISGQAKMYLKGEIYLE